MILTIAFTMAANITIVIWFMLSNFKQLLKMFCGKRSTAYYKRHQTIIDDLMYQNRAMNYYRRHKTIIDDMMFWKQVQIKDQQVVKI